jgi:hypothetical protein
MRDEVMKWFGDKDNFKSVHQDKPETEELNGWLGI